MRHFWWVWKLKKQTYLHLFFGSRDDKTAAQNLVFNWQKKVLGFFQPLSPKQNIASVDSKERDSAVRPLQQLLLLNGSAGGSFSKDIMESLIHHTYLDTYCCLIWCLMNSHLNNLAALCIYIRDPYAPVCMLCFFTLPIHDKLISMGSQSCKPQQTWSIWPCLHHQQTMASTSFGRRSDAAKRASKLQ